MFVSVDAFRWIVTINTLKSLVDPTEIVLCYLLNLGFSECTRYICGSRLC